MNVDVKRSNMNVHFKNCSELTYNEQLNKLIAEKKVCMRGLKADAKVFDEMIFDVNTDYFETHGGYEYAKEFYAEAYSFAVALYGEQNIISAVMHADELNVALTEQYGKPVYHYHMHLVALPVVEKQILWTKRCKDKSLVGTVKETVNLIESFINGLNSVITDFFLFNLTFDFIKPLLILLYFILQARQMLSRTAVFTTDEIVETGSLHVIEEIILQDTVRGNQYRLAFFVEYDITVFVYSLR